MRHPFRHANALARYWVDRAFADDVAVAEASLRAGFAGADVVLTHPIFGRASIPVARSMGIPVVAGQLYPMMIPTRAWTPPLGTRNLRLPTPLNRLAWWALLRGTGRTMRDDGLTAIGQRSVLLVGSTVDVGPLADEPGVVPFAPMPLVLPRCAVAVVSGALGGMAAAMHAGVPIVVHPQLVDQLWNGGRVEQLGVGLLARRTSQVPYCGGPCPCRSFLPATRDCTSHAARPRRRRRRLHERDRVPGLIPGSAVCGDTRA